MAILSQAQARQYAGQAGFSGNALNIIVAIAQAESSLNTLAQNTNTDGSIDRGILQINSRWHPEVSNTCAYDPVCSFKSGYTISSRGTNFSPWSTYVSGAYLRYLNTSGQGSPTTGSTAVGQQWYNYPIFPGNEYATTYKGPGTDTPHYAVDIEAPLHTPFYFLEPGTIVQADFAPWGGEVFEKPDAPGRPEEYVYHLDQIDVSAGQHVQPGQVVGLSGGQNSGGFHPISTRWSSGPHIHFGLFEKFVSSPIGTIPYGPDPRPLLQTAVIGNTGTSAATLTPSAPQAVFEPLSKKVNALLSEFPGFAGIAIALDEAEQFPGIIWYSPGDTIANAKPWWQVALDNLNPLNTTPETYTTISASDYVGAAMRSVLDTVVSNTIPFLFRGMLVALGLLLVIGLLWNAVSGSSMVQNTAKLASLGAAA